MPSLGIEFVSRKSGVNVNAGNMLNDKQFDIFLGSTIGSFKHVKYFTDQTKNSKKCLENLVNIKTLQKDDAITVMSWADKDQTKILLARKNKQIQVYNTQKAKFTKTIAVDFGTGDVVGVGVYGKKVLAGVSSGVVKIWGKTEESTVAVGGKIDRMRMCSDDTTLFATGGEENDLKVWRIGDMVPIFTAKNLPHDWLQLRRPIWVSDLTFIPDQGGNLLAVCSRHGYVRLYDIRAQRRPVSNLDYDKGVPTCIEPSFDSRHVLVGCGRGQLNQIDLRKAVPDKGFKGCVGSVTGIAIHRELRLVLSTSLDRYFRIHNYDTKEMLYKLYVTTKPSCILIQTETSTPMLQPLDFEESQQPVEVKVSESDMDQLFDEMEQVGEKRRKTELSINSEDSSAIPVDTQDVKPSTEGSTDVVIGNDDDKEAKIMHLLKSTERQKRRIEKRKREKKQRSVFYNA